MKKIICLSLLLSTFFSLQLYAKTGYTTTLTNRKALPSKRYKLKKVVVVGKRVKRSENQSEALTVIKKDEITQSGARSVAELLAVQEGVHIEKYGGLGQMASVSIRGNSNARILVLLNGIPINPAQGGGVDFSSISIDNIQRIEIIRGGASALYGENAFGGVINIITLSTEDKTPHFNLSLSYSSYNTKIAAGNATLRWKNFKFSPFFALGSSDGGYFFPGQSQQQPSGEYTLGGEKIEYLNSGFSSYKLGFQLQYAEPKKGFSSSLYYEHNKKSSGAPGAIEFPTVNAAQQDLKHLLSYQLIKNKLKLIADDELIFRMYLSSQERLYRDYDLFASDDRHYNRAWGSMLILNSKIKKSLLKIGIDFRNDYLDSTKFASEAGTAATAQAKTSFSLYSKLDLKLVEKLTIVPAIRFDHHSLHEDALSPKLGLLLDLSGNNKFIIKANFGHAYRPPSFNDLFWSDSFFAAGNKDLKAEKCWTGDIGLLVRPFQFLRGNFFVFYSSVRDMIIWQPSAGGIWRPSNIGKTEIIGIETEIKAIFYMQSLTSIIEMTANYTLQYASDKTDGITKGNQLPRQPHEKANCSFTFKHFHFGFLRITASYLGFRFINMANTKYLGDYMVMDIILGINITSTLGIELSMRNALDTSYIHFREYPVPGRELGIKIHYKW